MTGGCTQAHGKQLEGMLCGERGTLEPKDQGLSQMCRFGLIS